MKKMNVFGFLFTETASFGPQEVRDLLGRTLEVLEMIEIWTLPKIRGTLLGVPIIRIIIY